jgi:fructokinase
MQMYGGIEAGGTKFVCGIGGETGELTARIEFPTTSPQETMERTAAFFRDEGRRQPLTGIGIGSFGPVDLNPRSPTCGYITSTPKPGWGNTDFAGAVRRATSLPVGFDTDVNVAALGESRWGAARGLDTFLYFTIGTGIGGGGMCHGKLLHGLIHPEMGHIRIPHDWQRDPYAGCCPYHGDCLEGLTCGPALEGRWGQRGETLPEVHPAWELEAEYLALAMVNFICTVSPQRLILGGGVMRRTHLFPLIRRRVVELLGGYIRAAEITERIDEYIVPPALGSNAGVLGAIALAQDAADSR